MAFIKMNYPNTIAKANNIKSLAADVGRVSDRLRSLGDDSIQYWRGEAAEAYRNECYELEAEIRNLKRKMETLADAIIKVAETIKAADEAAQANASGLSTGFSSSGSGYGGGFSSGGGFGGGGGGGGFR